MRQFSFFNLILLILLSLFDVSNNFSINIKIEMCQTG